MKQKQEFHFGDTGPKLLSFDPILFLRNLVRKWLLILVFTVGVGVASYIILEENYVPVYRTDATLVITSQSSSATTYSNLQSASNLATVMTELLNSSMLQKVVLEELGMASFRGQISAAVVPQTNLMTVQVTDNNPRDSFLVMQAILENHTIVTEQVVGDVVIETLVLPTVPKGPINSSGGYSGMMRSMVLAFVFSCGAVLMTTYLRNTVRSAEEAEQKLKCWCLGEVSHEKRKKTLAGLLRRKKSAPLITSPTVSFRFTESLGRVRRRIEQYMSGGKTLMVTSVSENEGKSTVAVNLALSLAQKHKRVLLIDLDLRKPACHKILNLKNPGSSVSEVIQGRKSLKNAIIRESLSGLEVLVQQNVVKYVDQMLSSDRARSLIEEAQECYDYVILDLPPMSVALDTEYIMERVDASVLVVQQDVVPVPALNRAIETLQGGKARLLGCVLNNVYTSQKISRGSYGYGSYNGYGNYGKGAQMKSADVEVQHGTK